MFKFKRVKKLAVITRGIPGISENALNSIMTEKQDRSNRICRCRLCILRNTQVSKRRFEENDKLKVIKAEKHLSD